MNHEYPTAGPWDDRQPLRPTWWQRAWRRFVGWWRRVWRGLAEWVRRPQSGSPSPATVRVPELLNAPEPGEPFTFYTPALGDAYNFRVQIRCSWALQGTAEERETARSIARMRRLIEEKEVVVWERIKDAVRPIARTFPPYRAAAAEEKLNQTLSGLLSDEDILVTVRARVDVDNPVRADLQEAWKKRLSEMSARELENDVKRLESQLNAYLKRADARLDGEIKKAHVELLRESQAAWRELLVDGLAGLGTVKDTEARWLAPYALKLAEDPQNASVELSKVLDTRVKHAEELLVSLRRLAENDRMEAISFAFENQAVLHRLLMYLGVDVPPGSGARPGDPGDPLSHANGQASG